MKRVSLATSLIQKFDKDLKDRILGANISKEALNKFREKEKKKFSQGINRFTRFKIQE